MFRRLFFSSIFFCGLVIGGYALAQSAPLMTLLNSNLVVAATVLTSNGVPGLTAPPLMLMVSAVPTNSTQNGRVVLTDAAWGKSYNGPGNFWDYPYKVIVDDAGNVIVTGYSAGSGTSDDYTTIKYPTGGGPAWTNRYDGPAHSQDDAWDMAADTNGNIYVTGFSANSNGSDDVTTLKYAADGTPLWTNRFSLPTAMYWRPSGLAVDPTGNVYLGAGAFDYTPSSYLLLKYDTSGNPVWTNTFNASAGSSDGISALALDQAGNIFATGSSFDGANFSYVTLKYAANGTCLWTNRYLRDGSESADLILVDSSNNVIVTGDSDGGSASHVNVTIKYSNGGIPLWTNITPAANYVGGGTPTMVTDPAGNILLTGASPGANGSYADFTTIKFSPAGTPIWTNRFVAASTSGEFIGGTAVDSAEEFFLAGNRSGSFGTDFFAIKYTAGGVPIWTNSYNGYAGSGDADDGPESIAVDANGNVYVTGYVTIGTSSAVNWETLGYTNIIRYMPPTNFVGTDTFNFTAYDNLGNSATGLVTVAVLPLTLQFNTSSDLFHWTAQGLQLQVDGARTTNAVVIYASTNLVNWNPIFSNTPTLGSVQYVDPAAKNLPLRFYRAVQ
jgi:Beta-propeller repeat